jgi:predicted small secreted protein
MSNILNSRTRLAGAAATVVLAALSLTACNDAKGVRSEGAGTDASTTTLPSRSVPTATTSAAPTSTPSATAPAADTGSKPAAGTGSKPAANTGATKAPASSGQPVTCEGSNTKMVAAPVQRPVNHMLLTVTNTGSKTCYLYGYPALRFTDAQAVPPVIEESHPQAVTTLDPGESGYASVSLSASDGSGSHGRTVKSLTVYFYGRSGNESVGAAAVPPLPADGLYIDDSLKTTYWEQSMDDALAW